MSKTSQSSFLWLMACIVLFLLPALLYNLDMLTFIEDEAIRAIVAQEMLYSGNFIVPTINGDFYYNKPPLFNWILAAAFWLLGYSDEWIPRVVNILFLLLYAGVIYRYTRRHFSKEVAALMAFAMITCGRILFWDSMLGLIDVFFSAMMFWLFMVIYHEQEKQRWYRLFLTVYLITAIGFLLKGLPALVFCGASLLTAFVLKRDVKRLFSVAHITGIVLLFLIVGSYYWAYAQHHELNELIARLFTESAKRTIWEYGIGAGILHLLAFPFETSYHFLPWTLLWVFAFHKKVRAWLSASPFIRYCCWIFLINILPYWTSPGIYPRYLHMLMPLLFIILIYFYEKHRQLQTPHFRYFRKAILGLSVLLLIFTLLPLFFSEHLYMVEYLGWKVAFVFGAMAGAVYFLFLSPKHQLLKLVLILLIFRLGYNMFVLPPRVHENDRLLRADIERIAKKYKENPLYLYDRSYLKRHSTFHLNKEREMILDWHRGELLEDERVRYIVSPHKESDFRETMQVLDSFLVRHEVKYLYVTKRKE